MKREICWCVSRTKRRSRLVRMPTALPSRVIGTPEILYRAITSSASKIICSGRIVIGSEIIPDSDRLTLSTLGGLRVDRQILVHDPDPAVLRQADRGLVLGHRVHRGREQRDVQRDLAREARLHVDLVRQHLARAGHEQHVVEGQAITEVEVAGRRVGVGVGHAGD
jgi:hypothetical protein